MTTNINKPSVSKIAGIERITMIGRKIELIIENINPARRKPKTPTLTADEPSLVPNNRTASQSPIEFKTHRTKNAKNCRFISYYYITKRSEETRSD